jgi:hypothetical protein
MADVDDGQFDEAEDLRYVMLTFSLHETDTRLICWAVFSLDMLTQPCRYWEMLSRTGSMVFQDFRNCVKLLWSDFNLI